MFLKKQKFLKYKMKIKMMKSWIQINLKKILMIKKNKKIYITRMILILLLDQKIDFLMMINKDYN